MDKNIKEAVGAEKPTVSGLLEETLRAMKPETQVDFEAAMWFEEIEAKQRATLRDMEEYYESRRESGCSMWEA
tara:strand:- start:9 stop:227 length:219 start_codon:yes stop_codon:yes gene_type:complete